jgi:hypothetical protein
MGQPSTLTRADVGWGDLRPYRYCVGLEERRCSGDPARVTCHNALKGHDFLANELEQIQAPRAAPPYGDLVSPHLRLLRNTGRKTTQVPVDVGPLDLRRCKPLKLSGRLSHKLRDA